MQDIRYFYDFLKNNISITIIVVYAISFINYYIYYYSFGIPIFNYVEITDLLFFFFEYLIQILLVIFLVEMVLFITHAVYFRIIHELIPLYRRKKLGVYIKASKRNRERFLKVFEKEIDDHLRGFKLTILLLSVFVLPSLPHKLVLFPTYFIYFLYILNQYDRESFRKLTAYIVLLIVFVSLIISSLYNGLSKRYYKDNYIISFKEGNALISTDKDISCLNYLGETSKNIFLYDVNSRKARIFSKENISDLQIDNSDSRIDSISRLVFPLIERYRAR